MRGPRNGLISTRVIVLNPSDKARRMGGPCFPLWNRCRKCGHPTDKPLFCGRCLYGRMWRRRHG